MRRAFKLLTTSLYGGTFYTTCELLWRGHTHWTMYVVGGLCLLLLGRINKRLPWSMPLWLQGLIATPFILAVEFIAGVVLNLWLKQNVWDYSALPFNLLGQICLYFAGAWFVLSIFGIVMYDYLDYWLSGGEKPHYKII